MHPKLPTGIWCRHGKLVLEYSVSDVPGEPRRLEWADPWPCGEGCTEESIETQLKEMGDE